MESWPATMAKSSRAGAKPLRRCRLPEEIVIWEILVRLPPKPLLRCRIVCRATSTRAFLQAHHRHQPSLPIVLSYEYNRCRRKNIMAFHHRAASDQLQAVARLHDSFYLEVSCDGLVVLSKCGMAGKNFFICNPATRQHAPHPQLSGFNVFGMYAHRPTGEYRLLLHQTQAKQVCSYVFVLGSNQPPRYIGALEVAASTYLSKPALVRDNLHWYPVHYGCGQQVILFDTASESLRHMRAPDVPANSQIFEMDGTGTLGIYSHKDTMNVVDIWMLHNYEREAWRHVYRIKLPEAQIKQRFSQRLNNCYVNVHSVDGGVLLLVNQGGWMFHVDIKGKLVHTFHLDDKNFYVCQPQLKQTLVPHTFFTTLEGYGVDASPFV
ncbi:unnamed protein product [Alopecurus aequalis]